MKKKDINNKIAILENEISKIRTIIFNKEKEIDLLKESRKNICKHLKTHIVTQSYGEPPKIPTFYWKEKKCLSCGKVIGTSSKEEKWSEFK